MSGLAWKTGGALACLQHCHQFLKSLQALWVVLCWFVNTIQHLESTDADPRPLDVNWHSTLQMHAVGVIWGWVIRWNSFLLNHFKVKWLHDLSSSYSDYDYYSSKGFKISEHGITFIFILSCPIQSSRPTSSTATTGILLPLHTDNIKINQFGVAVIKY